MQREQLHPGFVIAEKYVVERLLGRGGMGAVYVVSHATTGKRLALKVLLPEFVHDADIVSRFLREAQVMGRLQHRHVVDVFDVGRDGDVLFIVMELLDGKPLGELLESESITLEEALLIMLRAMEGIAAAHELGIVHRDIKPDNIFVCVGASGRLDDPRVLDFGISKLDDAIAPGLTRSGIAMGTPYYMSIEQLNGQRDLDARVDVYAVGVMLYEAISGEPPYVADSMSALAIRVLTTEPMHLRELRPDLPPGLADVVMKGMAKQREDRFRSMRQFIEALRPFVPQSAGLLVPEGQSRPLRTPGRPGTPRSGVAVRAVSSAPTPTRRGRTLLLGAAIVVLSGIAAALSIWLRDGREPGEVAVDDASRARAAEQHAGEGAGEVEAEQGRIERGGVERAEVAHDGASRPTGTARAEPESPPDGPERPTEREEAARAAGAEPARDRAHDAPTAPAESARVRGAARAREPERRATAASEAGARTAKKPARSEASPAIVANEPPARAALPDAAAERPAKKSAEGRAGKLGSDEF